MLLINDMNQHPNIDMGIDRSIPQLDEQMQFTLNGKKLLPFNGMTAQNKTQMVNDYWGSLCCSFFNDKPELAGYLLVYGDKTNIEGFSFGALKLHRRVDELQVEYTRTAGGTPSTDDPFNLVVYGEVAKQLAWKDGKMIVVNA